jgi:membrane protease YdiL (CAAX protease family)
VTSAGSLQPSQHVPQAPPPLPASHIVALHLAPGAVFSVFLWLLAGLFTQHGLTGYLAELIAIPICLAPLLAGIMRFWSRRAGEAGSVTGALTYRERGTIRDYVVWPILLYAFWGLCSLLILPLVGRLETWGFGWFPSQLRTATLLHGVALSAPAQRHVTFVLAILLSGGLAPLVEEAYFRGFLLPRMRHWGRMAPVASALLFGLYHFFTPWNLPAVLVAFLPVAFVVQARKNFRISLVVHVLFNLTGVLALFLGPAA